MRILDFLREYMDIRRDSRSYCKSCETYKEQLAIANHEKKILLEQVLIKPVPAEPIRIEQPQPIIPKVIPWKVQREMLEAEDRAKAATIRRQQEEELLAQININKNKGQSSEISVEELEKELAIGGE